MFQDFPSSGILLCMHRVLELYDKELEPPTRNTPAWIFEYPALLSGQCHGAGHDYQAQLVLVTMWEEVSAEVEGGMWDEVVEVSDGADGQLEQQASYSVEGLQESPTLSCRSWGVPSGLKSGWTENYRVEFVK